MKTEAAQSRKIRGTGLGLYRVKYLVEAHYSHVWVESEPGKRPTCFVRLPQIQGGDDG